MTRDRGVDGNWNGNRDSPRILNQLYPMCSSPFGFHYSRFYKFKLEYIVTKMQIHLLKISNKSNQN